MSAQIKPHGLSVADYLAFEERSEFKHEYINGELYAIAGTSIRHNRITLNLASRLIGHLRGSRCEVFVADVKLYLKEPGVEIFYYPDLMVCCEPGDDEAYYRARPCLIVEVLSETTARIDQREKLLAYTRLDSLQGYLLLEQDRMGAVLHCRAGAWRRLESSDPQAEVALPCTGLTVRLAELYEGTGWPDSGPR